MDSIGLSLALRTAADWACEDSDPAACAAHKQLCHPDAGGMLSTCKVRMHT